MKKVFYFLTLLFSPFVLFSQTASVTGSLNTPRWGHQAQLLDNGNVLVFGGNNALLTNYKVFSSSELYNPTTKSWTNAGTMNTERGNFSSVLLDNGNVLAIGGNTTNGSLNSCEIYDVSTGVWKNAGSLHTPYAYHTSVKLRNGKVLVAEGYGKSEIYDPNTDKWSGTINMKLYHGIGMAMILMDDGKVLAMGGSEAPRRVEIFDPLSGEWTLHFAVSQATHSYHSIIRLKNGNFLIVGTQDGSQEDQLTAEIFNPVSQAFSKTGNLLTNVGAASMVLLDDGKVLLYSMGDPFSPSNTKCIQIYNPDTGKWTSDNYNFIGANLATVNMLHNGTVLLSGGSWTTGNGASSSCYLVNQNTIGTCILPDKSIAVTGSVTCNGNQAAIELPESESGVKYQAFVGGRYTGELYTGGGELKIIIPEMLLSSGKNVVKVKAIKGGCSDHFLNDTAVVNVRPSSLPIPSISAEGATILCSGKSVSLSAPPGMAGYQWTNGAITQNIVVSTSGSHRVRIRDEQGCFSDYSEPIKVETSPSFVYAGSDQTVCINDPAFQMTESFPSYGGVWSGTGVNPTGLFDPKTSGAGTFTLNYSLCDLKDTKTVTVMPIPIVVDFEILADTVCRSSMGVVRIKKPTPGTAYQLWKGNVFISEKYASNEGDIYFGDKIDNETEFSVKGFYYNTCGSDTLIKKIKVPVFNPYNLTLGTKTPFVCRQGRGNVYIVDTRRNVYYQMYKGVQPFGNVLWGNGDTLFFDTGILMENATFSFMAYHSCGSVYMDQRVNISVRGPEAYFRLSTCNPEIGEAVKITNTSLNSSTFSWNFSSASQQPSTSQYPADLVYEAKETSEIKLICKDENGCLDTITKAINVINPVQSDICEYSISSPNYTNPVAVALDKEDNSYQLFDRVDEFHAYSPKGDSLHLIFENIPGFSFKHVLVKYNSKGTIQWATHLRHGSTWAHSGDIVTDSLGNVYITYYHGEYLDNIQAYSTDGSYVTFDPPHSSDGRFLSVIILKYDRNGMLQWYNTHLDFYSTQKISLAVDKDLNVYSAGESYLCKFNKDGNLQWQNTNGYADLEIDSKGNLWALGYSDLLLDKYNKNGIIEFSTESHLLADPTYIEPQCLKRDAQDNFFVAGQFSGKFMFNKDTLTDIYLGGSLHRDIFFCKFNSNGTQQWIKHIKVDKESGQLKGMDVKNGQIIFSGMAGGCTIKFNQLADKTYKNNIDFSSQIRMFIGMTDTTSSGRLTIRKSFEYGSVGADLRPYQLIGYSQMNDEILQAIPLDFDQAQKYGFSVKQIKNYNSVSVLRRADLSCLFYAPEVDFTGPENTCAGTPVQFMDHSSQEPQTLEWTVSVGDSSIMKSESNPTFTFDIPGTYQISLTAGNESGVGNKVTKTIVVRENPVFEVYSDSVCPFDPVTINVKGDYTYVFPKWTIGAGYTDSSMTINNAEKSMVIPVKATDKYGCIKTIEHDVIVHPRINVSLDSDLTKVCLDDALITLPSGHPAGGVYEGPEISSDGKYDASGARIGSFYYYYIYTDQYLCDYSAIGYIEVDACTSVNQQQSAYFNVFPNPSSGLVNIETNSVIDGGFALKIYDATGRLVLDNNFDEGTLVKSAIDLSKYGKGMYLVQFISSNGAVVNKSIIIN